MPNHVTNIVSAPKEVLDFMKSEDNDFNFENLVPMPECLNISEGTETEFGLALVTGDVPFHYEEGKFQERLQSYSKDKLLELKKLGQQALDNREKLGHQSWYGWSCEFWGTKWNSYDVERYDDDTVEFLTAWSCPIPIFEALSEKFPNAKIEVEFADEDTGSNCGTFTLKDGEWVEENIPENLSKEAYELSFRICGSEDYYEYNEEKGTYEYVEE
jgi:hypothetical protein